MAAVLLPVHQRACDCAARVACAADHLAERRLRTQCSSSHARRESSSARTLSASRVVRTAGRGRRHVQAGCTRSTIQSKRRCRQLASYAQPEASSVRRTQMAE